MGNFGRKVQILPVAPEVESEQVELCRGLGLAYSWLWMRTVPASEDVPEEGVEDGEDDDGEGMEAVLIQGEENLAILEQMVEELWWMKVMMVENFLHQLSSLHLVCYSTRIQYKRSYFLLTVWF